MPPRHSGPLRGARREAAALPALRKLRDPSLEPEQRSRFLALVERALQGAGSPFTRRSASAHAALSPREAEICDLLASGSTSKDIARILHVSPATVEHQRVPPGRSRCTTGSAS